MGSRPNCPYSNFVLQEKVIRCLNEVQRGNKDYNTMIQNNKEFRNPGIYEKLIDLLQLDEMGTNYPLVSR